MDIGLGVRMVWPLAAQEAAAAGAAELEPGHFFCGALKLAEMPASVFNDVVPNKELVPVLEEEQRQLCAALEGVGIRVPTNSTPLRRALRGLLRKEGSAGQKDRGGVIHRSAHFKALFARAEAAAQQANEKEVGISRLVKTLLADPDEALAAALAQIGNMRIDARPAADEAAITWIDAYGCDLTARARQEKMDDAGVEKIRRDAVCRVLAEVLFAAPSVKTSPVLLVSRGERDAAAVVNGLAKWLVSSKPPAVVSHGCILAIDSAAILNREAGKSPEAGLEDVFKSAATTKSTILFFDNFHRYLTPSLAGEGMARCFQTLLNNAGTTCVVGMTQKQYETCIEHTASWRNVFKLIWIHDANPNFQL
jgi:ATP-dependent Clp protease ATP-binding subunit ClpA